MTYTSFGGWFSKVKFSFRCVQYIREDLVRVLVLSWWWPWCWWWWWQILETEETLATALPCTTHPPIRSHTWDHLRHQRPEPWHTCHYHHIGKMICFFSPELDFWNMQKRYIRKLFCPKRSKHGCLHENPPNPSFGWITKKRSFSSELKFAMKGWGERGHSIF